MANADILKAGESYKKLRKVYVIMILPFDPFDKDRMVYTVKNMCVEDHKIPYEDGARTIYLYVNGKKGDPSKDLAALLKYMADTRRENAVNENLQKIQDKVEVIKADKEVQREVMKFEELIMFEREEAAEEAEKKAAEEAKRADAEAERANREAENAKQEAENARREAEKAANEAKRADAAEALLAKYRERFGVLPA